MRLYIYISMRADCRERVRERERERERLSDSLLLVVTFVGRLLYQTGLDVNYSSLIRTINIRQHNNHQLTPGFCEDGTLLW